MWWMVLLIGLLLSLLACPFFPFFSYLFFRRCEDQSVAANKIEAIDILIPCHNERHRLRQTLESIENAKVEAQRIFPQIKLNIFVALDACTDGTENDLEGFEISTQTFNHRNKWKVLNDLVQCTESEWIVFIDAGTIWDKRTLRNVTPYLSLKNLACFAPGYRIENSSRASKTFWFMEALLKSIENHSGGPVSVHGSTVFYRREQLVGALKTLLGRTWINDDVVLPLTIRVLFPKHRIHYGANGAGGFLVTDLAPRSKQKEHNGRRRIALGNLQWIHHLLPLARTLNLLVFFVTMRRIFRLIWALPAILYIFAVVFWAIEYAFKTEQLIAPFVAFFVSMAMLTALLRTPAFKASIKAFWGIFRQSQHNEDEPTWS